MALVSVGILLALGLVPCPLDLEGGSTGEGEGTVRTVSVTAQNGLGRSRASSLNDVDVGYLCAYHPGKFLLPPGKTRQDTRDPWLAGAGAVEVGQPPGCRDRRTHGLSGTQQMAEMK